MEFEQELLNHTNSLWNRSISLEEYVRQYLCWRKGVGLYELE